MKFAHGEKKFKCETCGKAFARNLKLTEHIAVAHTREILFRCRVPGCEKGFRAEAGWKTHEKKVHPEEYEKIFKPFYKRAPNEPKPNVEEELKRLREANEVGELFEGF
jgi:uncharacterized C2H2 Zn-finger protein